MWHFAAASMWDRADEQQQYPGCLPADMHEAHEYTRRREKQEKAAAKERERQEKEREKQEKEREKQEKAAERERAKQQKEAEKLKEKAEKEVSPACSHIEAMNAAASLCYAQRDYQHRSSGPAFTLHCINTQRILGEYYLRCAGKGHGLQDREGASKVSCLHVGTPLVLCSLHFCAQIELHHGLTACSYSLRQHL